MTLDRFLVILLFFSYGYVSSQNLASDGSFENYKRCPQNLIGQTSEFMLKEWTIPTQGTTDYFNRCSKIKNAASVPDNQVGHQEALTGNGYIGLRYRKSGDYSEYIQSELSETLLGGEEYYVEFWISLAEFSTYGRSQLGAYFSAIPINNKTIKSFDFIPQIKTENFIIDTENWVKISGTFKAQGGEKYITIGGFGHNKNNFIKIEKKQLNEAYYYLDDVLVERVKKDTVQTKQFASELNKPIILKNITFEFGKSKLKESSFAELNKLIVELQANPNYQITLSGYTDNVGQEEDNLKLSQARAKAVAEYLTSKGIAPIRITYKGYGSKQPITTNETEQGREQNRRVEFILTQDEK